MGGGRGRVGGGAGDRQAPLWPRRVGRRHADGEIAGAVPSLLAHNPSHLHSP